MIVQERLWMRTGSLTLDGLNATTTGSQSRHLVSRNSIKWLKNSPKLLLSQELKNSSTTQWTSSTNKLTSRDPYAGSSDIIFL